MKTRRQRSQYSALLEINVNKQAFSLTQFPTSHHLCFFLYEYLPETGGLGL